MHYYNNFKQTHKTHASNFYAFVSGDNYHIPYEGLVPKRPSFTDMENIVSVQKIRPST